MGSSLSSRVFLYALAAIEDVRGLALASDANPDAWDDAADAIAPMVGDPDVAQLSAVFTRAATYGLDGATS